MTYCVGLKLNKGMVFMSDTRTNAGVDNISVVKKLHSWSVPGERMFTLLSAGNLATTQSVISLLDERTKRPENRSPSLMEVPTMFQAARLIGDTLKEVIQSNSNINGQQASSTFNSTMIFGGQIQGMPPRLFLVYPEGNFIEAGDDAPFFQIGEAKYGKPILVRAYSADMDFESAVKLLLVSFDSTIKANLSVGLPLDYNIHETDNFFLRDPMRITSTDTYFQGISAQWGDALQEALNKLPNFQL